MQLQLPFEATGLSERIQASGRLKLTPDYDVLAWLCERWQRQPTTSGWMHPTFYELGSALYGKPPSGKDYRELGAALMRLAWVNVTIDGYDLETGAFERAVVSQSNLLELTLPRQDPEGLDRLRVRLAEWLRQALAEERVVRLPWQTLRLFHQRQALAKRLWVYLACERWKRTGDGAEGTWVAIGDRLFAALGMDYAQPRQARAAIKRACQTVCQVDARYAAGELHVVKSLGSWKVIAKRPLWETWREARAEHAEVRRILRDEGFRRAA
jgi:hypothetical protein